MTNGELLGRKLYELRKKYGLSQEGLAERLGVSRQAVSKWECGESLPDTDNLITISKMYGVSLDELVGNTVTQDWDTAYGDEEDDGFSDKEIEVIEVVSQDGNPIGKKRGFLRVLYELPYILIVTVIFLFWGFMFDGWNVAWTLFITVPLYDSVIDCIRTRKFSPFDYTVFVTFVYLFIGMKWGLWHPWWIIYITIPIYYAIADAIDKR